MFKQNNFILTNMNKYFYLLINYLSITLLFMLINLSKKIFIFLNKFEQKLFKIIIYL